MASTTKAEDLELRDKVRSIEQTQREVLLPKLEAMAEDLKEVVQKDYMTEEKADKKFATKEQIKRMEILFWGIISAVLLGLVNFVFRLLERS